MKSMPDMNKRQLLIKKFKADWRLTDDWGWNILHEAAASPDKNILMIRYIMKECKDLINQTDKLGRTPLLLGLLSNIREVCYFPSCFNLHDIFSGHGVGPS